MQKYNLVTGGTGFIGSHLVEALISMGDKVKCLVRTTSNVRHLKKIGVELVYGDLLDQQSLEKAVRDTDIVYHLAAKVRPCRVFERVGAHSYRDVNVIGTVNLINACNLHGIKKFIYFSSIAAAGPGLEMSENSPCRPITAYGKSKLEAERYITSIFATQKFPAVILRPGLIYGPRGMATLILSRIVKKGIVPIIGNGSNFMPVCYIDDLIKATLSAVEKGRTGEIYFTTEKSYMFRDLIESIEKGLSKNAHRLYIPENAAYGMALIKELVEKAMNLKFSPFCIDFSKEAFSCLTIKWTCNNEKAKKEFNFMPNVSLEEGMERTINWYKNNGLL